MHEKDIPYQIDRYIKGHMTEEEKDRLWEAFLEHPEWLEWLVIEVNARDYIQNVEGRDSSSTAGADDTEPVLTEPADGGGFKYIISAAAAILIGLTGLLWFLVIQPGDSVSNEAVSSIDYPAMVTPEVFRAPGDEADPLDVSINTGVEAALSGRLDESMEQFNSVLASNPDNEQEVMARFNRGILHYNLGEYGEAAEEFLRVTENDAGLQLSEYALWYLGLSLLQLGETDAAEEVFNMVTSLGGLYENDARDILERLD